MKKAAILALVGILILSQVSLLYQIQGDQYLSISKNIKLQQSWVNITVYYFEKDKNWAKNTLNLTAKTLPILEKISGFPYPNEYDVTTYQASTEESGGWGGRYGGEEGIWITSENCDANCIIHENAHAWTQIYRRQWMSEGFANFYAFLVLEDEQRKNYCYAKSFTFVYLIYKELGLEALQEMNHTAYETSR